MKKIRRIVVSMALCLAGTLLFAYGVSSHPSTVFPEKGGGPGMRRSELQLVKEASIGGVRLDEFGNIRLTYTGTPPKDCAT